LGNSKARAWYRKPIVQTSIVETRHLGGARLMYV
jgi:hypothetical protein